MPGLASIHAGAQDARQRTTLTIVQDALAQLPAQTSEDLYGEMSDIAGSAPESVELLAGMLVPASEGQNALVEYALNGIVNFACANGNEAYAAPVRAGLAAGLEKCGDTANKALLLSLFRLLATADDIPIFLEYAGDPTLGSVAVNALISIEGSDEAIMDLIKSDGASRPLLAYAAAEKGLAAAEPPAACHKNGALQIVGIFFLRLPAGFCRYYAARPKYGSGECGKFQKIPPV